MTELADRLPGQTVLQKVISDFSGLVTFLSECFNIQIHILIISSRGVGVDL